VAISVGVTLISAVVGSFTAVRRIAALTPAEGMRPETPMRYGRGALDRLRIMSAVSPPVRMILRSLQRTPFRALMSILAMSMAGMILVATQFSFDSIESLMDIHFRTAQTDDATIELNEVRNDEVLQAVRRLPGVTNAEPMRAVPIRIVAGHRSRRVALIGLERGATMRRLIGANGEQVTLPRSGLVLTRMLADVLAVRPGDEVRVEALETPRSVASMRVAALVNETMGISAYAAREDVNRFMHEGPTLSAAQLGVQPGRANELYARLKATPHVASITLREAMLASIRKTIIQNIYISAFFVIPFACVIAFGVIYNGARITLSERGRDLASLRVLGFSKGEVSVMLLGEQALLTLASIPTGFVAGWGLCIYIARAFESEVFRIPLVISARTYAISFFIIVLAAVFTGIIVQRRIAQLDLVEVLKSRE
jgi:putative ABC transport system permease protein